MKVLYYSQIFLLLQINTDLKLTSINCFNISVRKLSEYIGGHEYHMSSVMILNRSHKLNPLHSRHYYCSLFDWIPCFYEYLSRYSVVVALLITLSVSCLKIKIILLFSGPDNCNSNTSNI